MKAAGGEAGNRRRVLILYYSSAAVCGVGTWVETLAEELGRRGWDVVVGLAWGRVFHDPRNVEKVRPGLRTVWMDGRTGTEEGRVQAIEKAILRVRPSVVILANLNSAFEAVARLRQRGLDFRFVATNHGTLAQHAACLLEHRNVIDLAACVSRLSFRVMSDAPEGFSDDRIRHLPQGVPLPRERPGRRNDGVFRLGYAGRLDADKRTGDVLEFFRKLHAECAHAELRVGGEGPGADDVMALSHEFPDHVKFLTGLTRNQLYESFYPYVDVMLNFSANEGWGLTLGEAMAHGAVPISSAFRGIYAEGLVVNKRNGLIFPVGDVDGAVAHVVRLARDPGRREAMGRQAEDDIRQGHTVEHFGSAWAEALDHCLGLPSLPAPDRAVVSHRGRLGLPERYLEPLRRMLRRRVPHGSSSGEWPHFSCRDNVRMEQLDRNMTEMDVSDTAQQEVR